MRTQSNMRALRGLENEASHHEQMYHEHSFGVGNLVLHCSENPTKLHPRWDSPFIIHNLTDRNTYQLHT